MKKKKSIQGFDTPCEKGEEEKSWIQARFFCLFFFLSFFFSFLIQSKRILHHISTSRLCFQRRITTKYIQCTVRQRYRGRFGVYIIIYRSYRQRGTFKLYATTQLNISCCREKAQAGRRADMHTTTKQPSNAIKQQWSDRRETSQHTHAHKHTHTPSGSLYHSNM